MLTRGSFEFFLEILNQVQPKHEKIIIKDNKTGEVLCELSREALECLVAVENPLATNKKFGEDWTAYFE